MIEIRADKKTVVLLHKMDRHASRMRLALHRFVKTALQQIMDGVRSARPGDLSETGGQDGGPLSYADLELVDVVDIERAVTYAVVLPIGARRLTASEFPIAAVYVHPTGQSTLLSVLQAYSPWPADLLPSVPPETEARLVIRLTSKDEIDDLRNRLLNDDQLKAEASAIGITLAADTTKSIDRDVEEDIGWRIVREEFGLEGSPLMSHWRPAIRDVRRNMQALGSATLKYVLTGDEDGLLDLNVRRNTGDLNRVLWFQDKISKV